MSKTGLIVEGGANRVYFAVGAMDLLMENNIKADFYIASEAGITDLLGNWIDINSVVVEDSEGFQSVGTSQGFPIPEKYIKEILETELGKVEGNITSAKLASIMGPANALAGVAIGIGADNSAIGSTVTTALDAAAEKIGQRGADATRKALYEEAKSEGRDNPDILRQGTTKVIKQEINFLIQFSYCSSLNGELMEHKHLVFH